MKQFVIQEEKPIIYRGFAPRKYCTKTIKVNDTEYRGCWVTGTHFVHVKRTPCPIGDSIRKSDISHLIIASGFSDWNMPREVEMHEVIPGTICRKLAYIPRVGEVFSGDIVRFKLVHECQQESAIGVVGFDPKNNETLIQRGDGPPLPLLLSPNTVYEVLGNIFENDAETIRKAFENGSYENGSSRD